MNVAPLQFLLLVLVGWANRRQLEVLDYLKEENRVRRDGSPRTRPTSHQATVSGSRGQVRDGEPGLGLHKDSRGRLATLDTSGAKYDQADPLRARSGTGTTRGKRMPWRTFLKAHFGVIAAMDFFSVEVLTFGGLVRYFVLFVIDLETRRVEIAGIVRQPHGAWMKQIGRNLTDGVDGFLKEMRYVIHDRDPLFTDEFRRILRDAGVKPIKLPTQSPGPECLR